MPVSQYFVITVKCFVAQVYQTNIARPSIEIKVGASAVQLLFNPFQQTPMCNFKWSYTLTIFEIKTLEDKINFEEHIKVNPNLEGYIPENLGRISTEAIYLQTGNSALKDRFFVAFISGVLATNPLYQPNMKLNFELVRFKVVSSNFIQENSPPEISNLVGLLTIFANE